MCRSVKSKKLSVDVDVLEDIVEEVAEGGAALDGTYIVPVLVSDLGGLILTAGPLDSSTAGAGIDGSYF